jgi:hypothetical protein
MAKRPKSDAEAIESLIADLAKCCQETADIERRLRSLNERYVVDVPLVRAAKTVRLGQEAILEGLRRAVVGVRARSGG